MSNDDIKDEIKIKKKNYFKRIETPVNPNYAPKWYHNNVMNRKIGVEAWNTSLKTLD